MPGFAHPPCRVGKASAQLGFERVSWTTALDGGGVGRELHAGAGLARREDVPLPGAIAVAAQKGCRGCLPRGGGVQLRCAGPCCVRRRPALN